MRSYVLVCLVLALPLLWLGITEGGDGDAIISKAKVVEAMSRAVSAAMEELRKPKNVKKIAKFVRKMLGCTTVGLGPFSTVIKAVFAMVPEEEPKELVFLREAFGRVERALSELDQKMDMLSSKISWQTSQLSFEDDENDINLTYNDMLETLAVCEKGDMKAVKFHQEVFIQKYKKRDLEGSLDTLFNALFTKCTFCDDKLLKIFEKHTRCKRVEMVAFINSLTKIFSKGQKVVIAYYDWNKKPGSDSYVQRFIEKWKQRNEDLEKLFTDELRFCVDHVRETAKEEVKEVLDKHTDLSHKIIAKDILAMLRKKYDWLDWTVLAYGKFTTDWDQGFTDCGTGQAFALYDEGGRNLIAGWRDAYNGNIQMKYQTLAAWTANQVCEAMTDSCSSSDASGKAGMETIKKKLDGQSIRCNMIYVIRDKKHDGERLPGSSMVAMGKKQRVLPIPCLPCSIEATIILS